MDLTRLGEGITALDAEDRALIIEYVKMLETGTTRDHCMCEWIPVGFRKHPETGEDIPLFRKGDTNQDCPVHTREGLLLGFLVFTNRISDALYAMGDPMSATYETWREVQTRGVCPHGSDRSVFCFLCWLQSHTAHQILADETVKIDDALTVSVKRDEAQAS